MGRRCSILKCPNRKVKAVQVFQLPKQQERKRQWLNFIKEQNKHDEGSSEQFLCFKHFSNSSWNVNRDRSRLLDNAIPTIGCSQEDEVVLCL